MSLDRLLIDLFIAGHNPEPVFARDRVNWRAKCPCWPGHWLMLLRGCDGRPVLRCDSGCDEQHILECIRADAAGAASCGFDFLAWGPTDDELENAAA